MLWSCTVLRAPAPPALAPVRVPRSAAALHRTEPPAPASAACPAVAGLRRRAPRCLHGQALSCLTRLSWICSVLSLVALHWLAWSSVCCRVRCCAALPDLELRCTMLCCWVPCCIALLVWSWLCCTAFPSPILHCAPLPCVLSHRLLCRRVGAVLGAVPRYATRSRIALPCAMVYLDFPCVARLCLPTALLRAASSHAAAQPCSLPPQLCHPALPACIRPSHLLPRCLLYPVLPGPARAFLVPYGVVLPTLLPAAPPRALLPAAAFSFAVPQSLCTWSPSPADPSQGPALPCPAPSVLPLAPKA